MSAGKTVSISFRASPNLKTKVEAVAMEETHSRTSMIEILILDHCQQEGVTITTPGAKGESGARR